MQIFQITKQCYSNFYEKSILQKKPVSNPVKCIIFSLHLIAPCQPHDYAQNLHILPPVACLCHCLRAGLDYPGKCVEYGQILYVSGHDG